MPNTGNHEFSRSHPGLPVEIRSVEGVMVEGRIEDVNLNEVSLFAEKLLPVGKECTIVLLFEKENGEPLRLSVGGTVARAQENVMAITFHELDGQKIENLRKYIRFSLEGSRKDEDRAESQFIGR